MRLVLLISAIALFTGCGASRNTATNGQEETGWAVHYGERDQGNSTASGEPYDHTAHTASHRYYPFGSRVKVTNLNNGRHTQVRINDRPGQGDGTDIIIGLSGAAASDLWMLGPGRAPVRLEVLMLTQDPSTTPDSQTDRLADYRPSAASSNAYPANSETYPAGTKSGSATVFSQEGIATYYNDNMQGRETASGELFDQAAYTASHATIPLGTEIRVINLDRNQEEVWVIVNDRMPELPDRIISLSRAAASEIGVVQAGKARVRIEYGGDGYVDDGYVDTAPGFPQGSAPVTEIWTVQVAALASRAVANDNVRELGDDAWLEEIKVNGKTMYRLFYREVFSREEAITVQAELARRGYSGTFIRRIE